MPTPLPTQLSGARFLAERRNALLADAPRVGKTGAAIIASDYEMARRILVVTTASGRPVWRRGFRDWSCFERRAQIITPKDKLDDNADVAILGWGSVSDPALINQIIRRKWDRVILDESHWAKSFGAKRTQAVYGVPTDDGALIQNRYALAEAGAGTWCLSGTPLPNSPADLYPMMRSRCPDRLKASGDWPDVTLQEDFLKRYTYRKPKKIGHGAWARTLWVVTGGRNEEELRARLGDFMLRRTQADVGIQQPIYDTFPLLVSDRVLRQVEQDVDKASVLAAAREGNTKSLDMHMGPLRRLTGEIKARAVVEAVREEFEGGLEKIVLMSWHKEVMNILRDGLSQFGVVGIDGSTTPNKREEAEQKFLHDPKIRVFNGQILAAGEAIDLSSADNLIFVESSWVPKDMAQAALRVTNHTAARQALVRVAVLEGSIDEAIQTILLRKWSSIREVLK